MSVFSKIRSGLVVALPLTAIFIFGVLDAQEPRRDQNNPPLTKPSQEHRPGVPGNGPLPDSRGPMPGRMANKGWANPKMPSKPDKELESWIKILAEKMTDRNDDIRNSARRGLVSVGPAAMFSLKEMAESKDAATALAARNVMMEIGRSSMHQQMMMQKSCMPFGATNGMPGMGGWGKMNPQDMNRKAGRPEGDRKGSPGADRPEGDRKGGPGDRGVRPGTGGPTNQPREGDRKGGPGASPGAGPEARERILNELNLSKDVRTKVEDIMTAHQEKMKDIITKGKEGNGDREKIMAEIRELQQAMMKNLKETMGDDKFQTFMKSAPMFNRGSGPEAGRGRPQGPDSSRQKQ